LVIYGIKKIAATGVGKAFASFPPALQRQLIRQGTRITEFVARGGNPVQLGKKTVKIFMKAGKEFVVDKIRGWFK